MLLQAHDYLRLQSHRGVRAPGRRLRPVGQHHRRRRPRPRGSRATPCTGSRWPLLPAPDGSKLGKSTGGRVWLDPARTARTGSTSAGSRSTTASSRATWPVHPAAARRGRDRDGRARGRPGAAGRPARAWPPRSPPWSTATRRPRPRREARRCCSGANPSTPPPPGGGGRRGAGSELPGVGALEAGVDVVDALVATGLATSRATPPGALAGSAVSVNGRKVDGEALLGPDAVVHDRYVLLAKGKRRYTRCWCATVVGARCLTQAVAGP